MKIFLAGGPVSNKIAGDKRFEIFALHERRLVSFYFYNLPRDSFYEKLLFDSIVSYNNENISCNMAGEKPRPFSNKRQK